tara:strand:+ start:222 stop:857 length:636 start_codon:yes stop_codon:yes gene_type:complete
MKSKQLKIIIIVVLNIGMHHLNLHWIDFLEPLNAQTLTPLLDEKKYQHSLKRKQYQENNSLILQNHNTDSTIYILKGSIIKIDYQDIYMKFISYNPDNNSITLKPYNTQDIQISYNLSSINRLTVQIINKTFWQSLNDMTYVDGFSIMGLGVLAGIGIFTALGLESANYDASLTGALVGFFASYPAMLMVANYKRQEPPKELLLNEWKVIN